VEASSRHNDKKKQESKTNSGGKKQSIFNNIINIIRGTPRVVQPVKKIQTKPLQQEEEISEEQMMQKISFENAFPAQVRGLPGGKHPHQQEFQARREGGGCPYSRV